MILIIIYLIISIQKHNHNCMDSISSDPQFVLGSFVKSPNNKFVEGGLKG